MEVISTFLFFSGIPPFFMNRLEQKAFMKVGVVRSQVLASLVLFMCTFSCEWFSLPQSYSPSSEYSLFIASCSDIQVCTILPENAQIWNDRNYHYETVSSLKKATLDVIQIKYTVEPPNNGLQWDQCY